MLVSDAGVLAASLADDGAEGRAARQLFLRLPRIAIPTLGDIEAMSVLRKWWLRGIIDVERFSIAMNQLAGSSYQRHDMRPFLPRVFELRTNVTAYDAVYVALAEVLGCPLATTDGRLSRASGIRCPVIVVS